MSMTKFVMRRVLEIFITMLIIATLIFALYRLMPADPASMVLNAKMTPELRETLRIRFGLDKPLWEQYLIYINNLLHGEFGTSFYWEGDVFNILKARLLPTILLFTTGTVLAHALGIYLGRIIAWRRGGKLEYGSTTLSLFLYTMPIFWVGLLAIWVFSYKLDLFPVGGMKTPEIWSAAGGVSLLTKIADVAHHLFLPLTVYTLVVFAGCMLLMKNSMLETVREDYIITARAKGLPETVIRNRHAARNALLPVVTAMSLAMAFSFNGGVIAETTFSWPGLGKTLVEASMSYDYPLAQGAFIMLAGVVLVAVLFADILYAYLDPRITY